MPRKPRYKSNDAFYHVISRGVEQRDIFLDQHDFHKFINICEAVYLTQSFKVHSYCLMHNHFHLYIETIEDDISKIIQRIKGRYSQYFNKKYQRKGPLFEKRFESIIVESDNYSKILSAYIHLNPVKANLVKRPSDWHWSSYRAYLEAKPPQFLEINWLLSQFSGTRNKAKKIFTEFTYGYQKHYEKLHLKVQQSKTIEKINMYAGPGPYYTS